MPADTLSDARAEKTTAAKRDSGLIDFLKVLLVGALVVGCFAGAMWLVFSHVHPVTG